jgi:hypothetical protein
MSEKKYHCRKCGAEVLAGPYVAPELCHACQLVAHAEQSASSDITSEMVYRVAELHGTIKQQADEIERNRATMEAQATLISDMRGEIERLKSYTAAYNTLLAERVEIECLRGLAVRAWHSFRSGLTATGGCTGGLTDADILELAKLSNTEAAKNRERDVLRDCQQGNQRCHECPDTGCCDNLRGVKT